MNVCVSVLRAMSTTHRVVNLERGVFAPQARKRMKERKGEKRSKESDIKVRRR